MATDRINRTRSDIFIAGAPLQMTKEQRSFFADQVEATIGPFSGTYEDAKNHIDLNAVQAFFASIRCFSVICSSNLNKPLICSGVAIPK